MKKINFKNQLAIVIPAYKMEFLDETLNGIANQSCKEFKVYIGDDNSPFDLKTIVDKYTDCIDITYHKFVDNIGRNNLVGHWDRCLNLVQSEKWVWLFSDDDLMDSNCVELFYESLEINNNTKLFHFNVKTIDLKGTIIPSFLKFKDFPLYVDESFFFSSKLKGKVQSYVVEYIFDFRFFKEKGGFENFDLAWCADDATWIKMIGGANLRTIEKAYVYWRYSGRNISSISGDFDFQLRKLNACIHYIKWVELYFSNNGMVDSVSSYIKIKWMSESIKNAPLSIALFTKLFKHLFQNYKCSVSTKILVCMNFIFFYFKKQMFSLIKQNEK